MEESFVNFFPLNLDLVDRAPFLSEIGIGAWAAIDSGLYAKIRTTPRQFGQGIWISGELS